jgi:hypothetical protein
VAPFATVYIIEIDKSERYLVIEVLLENPISQPKDILFD